MRRSSLAVITLLLAGSAAADDFYLPLGGPAWRTELELANPTTRAVKVTIDLLGNGEGSTNTTNLTLDGGASARWSDIVSEGGVSILRIDAETPLRVTASSHCSACQATSPVPILDRRFAIEEGSIPPGVRPDDPMWRSGIVVLNPGVAPLPVTLSLHRDDQVIEESSLLVPSRGMKRLRMERMFRTEREPGDTLTFHAERRVLLLGYTINERTGASVFTPVRPEATFRRRRAVRFTSPLPPPPTTQTIVLTPKKDNTLYQSTNGALSNGAGIHLFSGATASSSLRRALLAFDVAAQIPPGSRITRVTLTLRVSQTVSDARPMALHRVIADWGEGTSNAGSSRDGAGAPSQQGDATWIHRFFPDQTWTAPGGDFDSVADATTSVDFVSGTWNSSAAMIARVQEWLDQPSTNFGWIVIGDELVRATAKRFDSREVPPETTRPALTIDFER